MMKSEILNRRWIPYYLEFAAAMVALGALWLAGSFVTYLRYR